MCRALTLEGAPCCSLVAGADGRCWHHLTPEERKRWGYAAEHGAGRPQVAKPAPKPEAADPLADEPPLRRLPRLALDAELIAKLEGWAMQFDELDEDRYTAAEFIEWVRLEHQPRRKAVHRSEGPVSYPVIGVRMEAPRIPDRLLQVG